MKQLAVILLMAVISLSQCFAQKFINLRTYNVDSLLLILPDQQAEERVNTLNNLAVSLSFNDVDLSKQYADEAMNLSKELNYEKGIADAYQNYGHIYSYQGNYPKALSDYLEALSRYEQINDYHAAGWLNYHIAKTHFFARNYGKTIEYGNAALNQFREHNDDGSLVGDVKDTIRIFGGMGIAYDYLATREKMIEYYPMALDLYKTTIEIEKKNNFDITEIFLYTLRLGAVYLLADESDSAKVYFDRALAYPDANMHIEALKYRPITGLGNFYARIGESNKAIFYLQKAYEWYNKTGFLYWSMVVSNDLGRMTYDDCEVAMAEKYFLRAERIFDEMITRNSWYRHDSLKYIVNFGLEYFFPYPKRQLNEMMWTQGKSMYYKLYQINTEKGNTPEALKYHIAYFNATDTLNKLQRNRELIEIQTRYESEQKDQQIGILSKDNTIQKLQIREQQQTLLILILGLVIAVIGITIIFYLFRLKKRRSHQLEEKVKERTQELNLAHEKLMVLDAAKTNFLKIISHEIRTPLNGIKGFTDLLKQEIKSEELLEYFKCLDNSIERLEKFSLNALAITQLNLGTYKSEFKPTQIDQSIRAVISMLKEEADKKNVEFSTNINQVRINADELLIKSALETIIENAIRFSPDNSKININTRKENNQYICEIKDNGEGFSNTAINNLFNLFSTDHEHMDQNEGLGLALSKLIIDYHQGELLIENLEPTGAKVTIKLDL